MRENLDQNNSEHGQFLRSVLLSKFDKRKWKDPKVTLCYYSIKNEYLKKNITGVSDVDPMLKS